jgi:two-component system copper resistance phosphate regulon response regulator CusR
MKETNQYKLLLVEDDTGVRESLAHVLTSEGYQILLAGNGVEALELTAQNAVDLVLLDLNLPKKNGWDTFEVMTKQNPQLPVIIITARPNQLFPALSSGAGALMEKPLDFPKLLQTIRDLLSEPVQARIARLAGKPAEFHYMPSHAEK